MMSVSFAVRRGGPTDADEIAAAHIDSIVSIGAGHYDPDIVSDWSAHKNGELYLNAMAYGESFYVAVETQAGGSEVLGFSSHCIRNDQHRIAVYVRGKVARCGIGSALFQAAEATAIAAGATSIHVAASLAAIEFL